jgi:hypothetical protein
MRLLTLAFLLLALGRSTAQAPPDSNNVWAPLMFLMGAWEGESTGSPGAGRVSREYRFALNQKFIEVRNSSTYAPQPKNPKGERHEDWGLFSFDKSRKRFVLRQFHVEGFVNQYVSDPAPITGPLVFTSESIENIPAGYRARETYTVTGPDSFTERFELASPGKDFELYSEAKLRRRK